MIGAARRCTSGLRPAGVSVQGRARAGTHRQGVPCRREVEVPVFYKGQRLRSYYVADFVCFERLIVEAKAIKALTDVGAQTINYLKATGMRALLLNFGATSLQYERIVNALWTTRTPCGSQIGSPICEICDFVPVQLSYCCFRRGAEIEGQRNKDYADFADERRPLQPGQLPRVRYLNAPGDSRRMRRLLNLLTLLSLLLCVATWHCGCGAIGPSWSHGATRPDWALFTGILATGASFAGLLVHRATRLRRDSGFA